MSELFQKSMRTLELPRVLSMLAEQTVSDEAKRRALALTPETEPEEVLRLLDQTDAARALIGLRGSPSFSGVKPVAEALDRADRGGGLNTTELLTIASLLTAARRTREYFSDGAGEKTAVDHLFLSLHGNRFLEERIKSVILDEDTISDNASPELNDIRRKMRAAQAKSRQVLQRIISSPAYSKVLQESIITQRDGRFVVPVKAEQKGALPGLVHDVSSTGATLFVEPMGVVQANNEYIELEAKEKKEIERILAELSADAANHREDIQGDYDALVRLDLIFARGQLSYKLDGVRPALRRDGAVVLRKARHPLLDRAKAVPIDIEIGDSFDTLVITGPNTGGKTVSLKTLGLLTLMSQCGLHIPVASGSQISVYERVLADVGDEQSIEQSLSTFSAHMTGIVQILKETDRRTLVLFDELGAGTDPVEGAALAVAIIQRVRRSGAKLAATTHYAELKTFAMTTAGVENASCEFDVESLRPTYRLLIGIPGKSNAFAISKRLGLPDEVVEEAKAQMAGDSVRFEDVLTQLEQKRQALEKKQVEPDRLYQQREEDARKARAFRTQMAKARDNAHSRGEA
ncbi:endonuclease MutS2, partial [Oscillibacter sp.]|uniref:endonuclease MutS2 n=1 Tax=Oscillibacter sp. TaxID=1945593 RepID=UPI002899AB47